MNGRTGRGVFGKLFSKKNHNKDERATEIGMPTNVKQHIHVSKNSETGMLEGLPSSWLRLLDTQITQAEKNDNPDAAAAALTYHMYIVKKEKQGEIEKPFKPFVTEEAINEEDLEIEKFLDKKHAHQSQDSDVSIGQSSEEDVIPHEKPSQRSTMPIMPSKNSIKKRIPDMDITATVENLTLIDGEPEESPILRKKEIANAARTDEEIYEELRRICNPDDPYVRFVREKNLGAGASGNVLYLHFNIIFTYIHLFPI